MSDHDVVLVGCSPVVEGKEASAPSRRMTCAKCGAEVWLSLDLLGDLMNQDVKYETITPMCFYTCLVLPEDVDAKVSDTQRKNLRAKGLSDADIDRVAERFNQLAQRGKL